LRPQALPESLILRQRIDKFPLVAEIRAFKPKPWARMADSEKGHSGVNLA
jgi:hypothetical protein